MPNLRYVNIQYSPVSDKAVKYLAGLGHLRRVHLKGTDLSPSGAEELAKRLGEEKLDFHGGALLGVATDPTILAADGCPVKDAPEGSAAHGVGIRSGDVIVGVDDDKVDSFETLRQLMSKRRGGEKIVVHYRRNNKQQKVDVVLGEWYADDATKPASRLTPEQRPDEPAVPQPTPRVYPARR
jgi:membrane-associated protease RseP (regulator of RpoE activity)